MVMLKVSWTEPSDDVIWRHCSSVGVIVITPKLTARERFIPAGSHDLPPGGRSFFSLLPAAPLTMSARQHGTDAWHKCMVE